MMMLRKTFLSTFFLCILSYSLVSADGSMTVTLAPENPEPNSSVTLTLKSYSFNVDTAMITWKARGAVVLKGLGEKTLTVKTGAVGDVTQVTVRLEAADGSYLEQRINITPSSVTLLYEAPKSYVPLLYEGRSLPADGAVVRVSAFPEISDNGSRVSPSSLAYSWYLNGTLLKNSSGAGKQAANIRLDYLRNENTVKVVVHSPLGARSEKTITIQPHAVMPLLYIYDQILGTRFARLVEKRFETVQDFTIGLEPFYVSNQEKTAPVYTWYLDNLPTTPIGGRILTLHPKENSYGSKTLTVSVVGPNTFVQKGKTGVEFIFDTRK